MTMFNSEFADNAQLRFGETETLPIAQSPDRLYFIVIEQDGLQPSSYNADTRGLNNLHRALHSHEYEGEGLLILCNWKGMHQSHTFVCDYHTLKEMIKDALGDRFCDELPCGLSH